MCCKYTKHLCTWLVASALCLAISPGAFAQADDIARTRKLAQSLAHAKTPEERNRLLTSHKEAITVALRRALIVEGNVLLAEGKYADARTAYDTAKRVAEQIGDKAGVGAALLNTGTVLYLQGNHEQAIEKYDASRQIFSETKDQFELARALMGIGLVRKDQGKLAEALNFLQQSVREFEALGTRANVEELTEVLNAIGSIYESQGNREAAIRTFEKSLARQDNPESALRIGNAHYLQGNILQALEYFGRAAKQLENEPNRNEPAVTVALRGNLANVYYKLGNYELSLKHYYSNLPLLENRVSRSPSKESEMCTGNRVSLDQRWKVTWPA
jgi:tetratricopeptide (TPR) repeat protein